MAGLNLPRPWREVEAPKEIQCRIPTGPGHPLRPVVSALLIAIHENEKTDFPILVEIQEGADRRRYSIRLSDVVQ